MALQKFNGFSNDDATSLGLEGWTFATGTGTAAVTAAAGPGGVNALVWTANRQVSTSLTAHGTITIGGNFKFAGTLPGHGLWFFKSGTSVQVTAVLEASGHISFYRGSYVTSIGSSVYLGSTAYAFTSGQQAHIQIKVVIGSGTSGSIEVRINGSATADLSLTSIDTKGYAGTATIDGLAMGNAASSSALTVTMAHFWATDGGGSSPYNGFLGEAKAVSLLPSGAGANTGLTPSTGSNYQCVDETAPISAADYVSGETAKDTYVFPDLGFTPQALYAFAIKPTALKSDAGARSIAGVVRYSGTDTAATAQALSQTHATHVFVHTAHPDGVTGALSAMTGGDAETMLNACEFGVELS